MPASASSRSTRRTAPTFRICPARFWPGGAERESEVVFSPRVPKGPVQRKVHVDEAILKAGDHHGSPCFQHLGFRAAMLENGPVDVPLADGLQAVRIGLAAEESARAGQSIRLHALG